LISIFSSNTRKKTDGRFAKYLLPLYQKGSENSEAAAEYQEDQGSQRERCDRNMCEIRFTDPGEDSKTVFM